MKDKILLFVPCYNCENQITKVLESATKAPFLSEILVVNNCSRDNTETNVVNFMNEHKDEKITLIRNSENYSLGGSHKVAFKYAIDHEYDYVITLHGDNQGNLNDINDIINNKLYQLYDCCLGSRFMKKSQCPGYSKMRYIGNIGFNIIYTVLFGRKLLDLGSGLNMYKVSFLRNVYSSLVLLNDTLSFNPDMISLMCYYKAKIHFFPIRWCEFDQISNVKIVRLTFEFLKVPLKYILNRKKYINSDHRKKSIENYTFDIIKSNK